MKQSWPDLPPYVALRPAILFKGEISRHSSGSHVLDHVSWAFISRYSEVWRTNRKERSLVTMCSVFAVESEFPPEVWNRELSSCSGEFLLRNAAYTWDSMTEAGPCHWRPLPLLFLLPFIRHHLGGEWRKDSCRVGRADSLLVSGYFSKGSLAYP